jgi:hypothetical protein
MSKKIQETTIFSYKLLLDKEGKLITEITSLPIEDEEVMSKCFKVREERNFFINVVAEAKRKFTIIHEWLENYCKYIS